jgi:hypothetical protein
VVLNPAAGDCCILCIKGCQIGKDVKETFLELSPVMLLENNAEYHILVPESRKSNSLRGLPREHMQGIQ